MDPVRIYHNARCSKSRETLALLREHGLEPEVVNYLETPPTVAELEHLLTLLRLEPLDLMRRGEAAFKDLGLDDGTHSREALIAAMVAHPSLLERPIVVRGAQAVVGRPPTRVLELL